MGYWNNPELTARSFRPDPRDRAIRIYRTGDLGRLRADGTLEHLGRTGSTVKVRGFTVEPAEVESALQRLDGVRNAAVILRKDGDDEPRLVGYVAAPPATSPTTIRGELAKRLPPYMVPSEIVVLDALPVRPSGKLDRNALPAPRCDARANNQHRIASDSYERALVDIWREVLGRPEIAIDDDFYELGGTSLQAFLIFAKIAARLSRDLPPTTMMNAPTVAKQAEILRHSANVDSLTLVQFRATGALAPLFVVHARFGDIMFVKEIVRDLKSNRPVYGFQPLPLDGAHRIPRSIEAIAAHYLADLRKVQPRGPYYLAGYSWGGHLALEMAQQLKREGESVAFLGLIDSTYKITYDVPGETAFARFKRHFSALRRHATSDYISRRIKKTLIHRLELGRQALQNLPNSLRLWLHTPLPYVQRADFYGYLNSAATARYIVKPYSGPIHMYASRGRSKEQWERWSPMALGGLTVREIPAGHFEMVWPPHSTTLAAALDECLDRIAD